MTDGTLRVAMWSGPRNLSTAMMRSFGSRKDTTCIDEPFYAAYLKMTGLDHPMREEIMRTHDTDAGRVAQHLATGMNPTPIMYQKHMTHHMIPGIPRDWMPAARHAFLIRHPARVIASYSRKMESVAAEDLGYERQVELLELACRISPRPPVVIDTDDLLAAPETVLRTLCEGLGIPFDHAMLAWSPGPKPEDGAWAPHWYDAVNASSGFSAPEALAVNLNDAQQRVLEVTLPLYNWLSRMRLNGD